MRSNSWVPERAAWDGAISGTTPLGWGPRFGLAYQINQKTVFRGGFGIFYASEKAPGLQPSATGFTASPSWSSADQGITPAYQWDQGFPAWEAPPFINPGFNVGQGVWWYGADEIAKLPSTNSWNFAISRVLGSNFVLDLTYTGSKGTHLASDRVNYKQVPPQYAYLGSLLNKQIDDPAVVALGFKPPFPSFKQVRGTQATLGQALRLWPQYSGVGTGGMQNHSGNSTYNALIVKVTKRFSEGLSLVAEPYLVETADRRRLLRSMDRGRGGFGYRRRRRPESLQPRCGEILRRARFAAHVQDDRRLRVALRAHAEVLEFRCR